jgi:hypothetical protein
VAAKSRQPAQKSVRITLALSSEQSSS